MENNTQKDISPKVYMQEDGIVIVEFWGEQREENAHKFTEEIIRLMELNKENLRILVDGTTSLKAINISTRNLYIDFVKKIKAKKVAVTGLNTLNKVIASFILARVKKEKLKNIEEVKFFSNKEEALAWLKE